MTRPKYVVEQARRRLKLQSPGTRRRTVNRLDKSEVERLIRSTYQSHSKYGLMIKTLFLSGARVDEFVHIRIDDLHLDDDPPQIYLSHCKKESNRYVPVLPALAQELRTHLNGRRCGYLFETNRNDRYSVRTVQSVVKSEAREAGIDKRVYPHILRHSIATILLDSGEVPIDQVQKFLGHLQLSTTPDLRRDQHPSAGRELCARHERHKVLNRSASSVDGSGPNDRPEESERLPDEIDDDSVRKYFTLTKQDLEQVDQSRGPANVGIRRSALYASVARVLSARHARSSPFGRRNDRLSIGVVAHLS